MRTVARLGGLFPNPSRGPPGAEVMWESYHTLAAMDLGYRLGTAHP